MNKNARLSINLYEDNQFQIKVNRNKNRLNNKIFPKSTKRNRIQNSPQNHNSHCKRTPLGNKDELSQNKFSKNKNKIFQLSKNDNLAKMNKQDMNKINYSERNSHKNKNEIRKIDTFNKIRNNYHKLNLSNKINKQNINVNHFKNNTNNLSDYKAKIMNNKNRIKNSLFKTQSFNTEFRTNIKNLNKTNYIKEHNCSYTVNNNLIDDSAQNSPDNLFEMSNYFNHENNLGIYRNEIQYPAKNNNLNIYSTNKKDCFHKFLQDDSSNNNYLVLKTLNNEKYNSNILLDNTHNNIQNKKKLTKYFQMDEKESNNNYLFSKKTTSNKNNNKLSSEKNSFIKSNDYNFQNLHEIYSPKLLSKGKKIKNAMDNYVENSRRHFYRKKCISRDKYNTENNKDDYFDEIVPNKDKTVYYKYKPNINCDFDRDRFSYISEYNINNYKYYNRKKNKNYKIDDKLTYQKFQLISIFCYSVEKLLILIIKCYFNFFINQMKQYRNSKNFRYIQDNDNKSNNILLLKRLNNKKKVKINIDYTNNFEFSERKESLAKSLTKLDSSVPLKGINDNKIYTFKVLSRNDITNDIYKKKSKSINRSQNIKINKYNIINNVKDESIIESIKKRKNLSFNKIYIPKHKNSRTNKYKSLKINTKFSNYNDFNNNSDIKNHTIHNIDNYQNTNPQNILPYNTVYNTINENESLIKKIDHFTALNRMYTIKKKSNNSIINMSSSNNYDLNSNVNLSVSNQDINNKKVQFNSKNIYTKPLFKKIRKKILEKEEKDSTINFSSGKKRNDNDYNVNENLSNINKNNQKYHNIKDDAEGKNENKIMNKSKNEIEDQSSFDEFIVEKKKTYNSNNNNFNNKPYENKNIINFINSSEKKINKTKIENNNIDISTKLNTSNVIFEKIKNDIIQRDYDIIRTIIVKDVCSKDKTMNIFIKYYECNFPAFKSNNINIHQLKVISTDSITLPYINKNKVINNENRNNKYLQQILTSIIEVDEKSKANLSVNNSNSFGSEDGSEINNVNRKYINKNIFTHNIVIYLTKILQNIYDDNKKMILYLFMRNLKRIQNQIYLKDSLMQINSLYKNLMEDDSDINNNIYNKLNKNDNQIIYNGGNELDISNGKKDINKRNILFYSADYNLINLKQEQKNKNNFELGTFLLKDFKIKEEDEYIKIKRHYSSSSINQIKNDGNMIIDDKNDIISKKNKLKDIISRINKDIISCYFNLWKKSINKYNIINNDIDNGMNLIQTNNRRNYSNDKIIEINSDDLYITNEVKFLDNGFDIEYDEIKNKNVEINNEILFNKKIDEISYKIHTFRYYLIKNSLKKNFKSK